MNAVKKVNGVEKMKVKDWVTPLAVWVTVVPVISLVTDVRKVKVASP